MADVTTLELVSQDDGLIKSTPVEETLKKITKMRVENIRTSNNGQISKVTADALLYVLTYLRYRHSLSDEQIKSLSFEDLNRIPEIIFADRGEKTLLFGWVPIFGWVFAGGYILFKKRVKYLRSLAKDIFDKVGIEQAIKYYPSPQSINHGGGTNANSGNIR